MESYLNYVGIGLATLLPIVNPVTTASVFAGLSANMDPAQRRHQSNLGGLYVLLSLLICFYAGRGIMSLFGLSLPGIRIAGGLILCWVGLKSLFPDDAAIDATLTDATATATVTTAKSAVPSRKRQPPTSIAFIPLTMPVTVGPAAMAMVLASAAVFDDAGPHSLLDHLAVLTVDGVLAGLIWLSLRSASGMARWLGAGRIQAVSRLMGFVLTCIGVQLGLNGLVETFVG